MTDSTNKMDGSGTDCWETGSEMKSEDLSSVPSADSMTLCKYNFNHKRRGLAVIINNRDFSPESQQQTRDGTDVDAEALETTFRELGFDTIRCDNLTAREMQSQMYTAAGEDHSDADCFVCAILSHGLEGRIYGTDYPVPTHLLTEPFKGEACPSLGGKPKIFLLQACRGSKYDRGFDTLAVDSTDAGPPPIIKPVKLPVESDFLLAYAVGPGYFSWRNNVEGSWFIREFCLVVKQLAYKEELLHILTLVNYRVSRQYESNTGQPWSDGCKQVPSIVSQLTKLCYFNPK